MTILASEIVDQAGKLLSDVGHIRTTATELLGWLNAGRRALAKIRPDAFSKTSSVQLAAGTRQTLPADGHVLFRLNTNMGTDGTTPGAAITPASRAHLDTQSPTWRASAAAPTVECFIYEAAAPLEYHVVPPNTGTGYVELTYGSIPAAVASNQAIGCSDIYSDALLNYVLYRAFSKPTSAGDTSARAVAYYAAFKAEAGAAA